MSAVTPRSFLFQHARLAKIALGILTCLQTFAVAAQERTTATQERPPSPVVATAIVKVYRDSCLQCHDSDGRGEVVRAALPKVPDFADPKWQAARRDAELSRSILEGKGKSMPAMKGKLGSVDVIKMVAFVRGFQGGTQIVEDEPEEVTTTEQPAAAVEHADAAKKEVSIDRENKVYQKLCSMCHGPDGKGTGMRASLPAIPDFADIKWQEGRKDSRLIVSVLDGKGAGMPPFRDKVDREKVRDLVAFIRAFSPSYASRTRPIATDFEVRFKQLEEEFENLKKQSRALAASTSSGENKPQSGAGSTNSTGSVPR